jgi:hypothetical protein
MELTTAVEIVFTYLQIKRMGVREMRPRLPPVVRIETRPAMYLTHVGELVRRIQPSPTIATAKQAEAQRQMKRIPITA